MKTWIEKGIALFRKYEETITYLIFGGLATLLNIVIYEFFKISFGEFAANSWGNAIDNVICILFAYCTNRAFVFKSKTVGAAARKEFMQFVGCRLGTFVLDMAVVYVGGTLIGGLLIPAAYFSLWCTGMKVLANVLVVVVNYILSKLIIFKKQS